MNFDLLLESQYFFSQMQDSKRVKAKAEPEEDLEKPTPKSRAKAKAVPKGNAAKAKAAPKGKAAKAKSAAKAKAKAAKAKAPKQKKQKKQKKNKKAVTEQPVEAPEAPEDLEEDPEEEEVQEPDQEMPEDHEHEVLSPVLDEVPRKRLRPLREQTSPSPETSQVAGDSQCSLHTLLQGQQQMLHQIADATKAVLESQNTPESELYATLLGQIDGLLLFNVLYSFVANPFLVNS